MSRQVSGWECQRCASTFYTRNDAVDCCPPERITYWECDSEEPHPHGTESDANDCTAVCRCEHSKLVHLVPAFGGCRKRTDGFLCGCESFRYAAAGGAE